jgi:hypothetical protein
MPLLPLKPMAQSRRGLTQVLDAKEHPLAKTIPGLEFGLPHALIEPLALRAAKALSVE